MQTYVKVGPSATKDSSPKYANIEEGRQENLESLESLLKEFSSFSWQIAKGMVSIQKIVS